MTTFRMHENTRLTPEQFVAGLTDFGPGRAELFANSADQDLVVHEQGDRHADVTEGSGGVWERLRYDWSDPTHVVLTTTESNAWGRYSGHTYNLTRRTDGTTDIDYVVVREGKNLRGRLIALIFGIVGRGTLSKAFRNSIRAIESRYTSTTTAAAS